MRPWLVVSLGAEPLRWLVDQDFSNDNYLQSPYYPVEN